MSTIVKRITKGTTLTLAELDANINNLNTSKLEVSGGTLTGRPKLANQDIDIIDAEYRNSKIIKHVPTQAELKKKDEVEQLLAEQKLIDEKQKKMAYEQLKTEGVKFTQVTDADFQQ